MLLLSVVHKNSVIYANDINCNENEHIFKRKNIKIDVPVLTVKFFTLKVYTPMIKYIERNLVCRLRGNLKYLNSLIISLGICKNGHYDDCTLWYW